MLLEEGMHMRVLELEGGLDPDEFIRNAEPKLMMRVSIPSTNYFIWLADRARRKFGGSTAEARMQGYESLLLPAIRGSMIHWSARPLRTEVAGYLGLDRNLVLWSFGKFLRNGGPRRRD